jgi:DNA-binding NtrC family response regulator
VPQCGDEQPFYNSCRNRHCPKCQSLQQAKWVEKRLDRLLPVPYFHVVFTERFLASRGVPAAKLSAGAREWLLAHGWPGNVRELQNALERAMILAGDVEIRADHLGAGAPSAERPRKVADLLVDGFDLDVFEREVVYAALERAGGNKTRAARLLGITLRRLYSMLASFGASESEKEDDG